MATAKEKKETQHVLVVTRVRPFNSMELEMGAKNCVELHGKDVIVKVLHGTKKFSYDRVFGMDSQQEDVYKTVISPMIEEIMQGYNCTVFAYGQTGTGKTYTMVGNDTVPTEENINDPELGIIPRTLDNLFTTLSANADVDFTVRVSYLELYNEVLIDLLSNEEKVLKIFEDQKVKGAVRVHGLEEETIFSKKQVFAILQKGSEKRMTAGTLMNARSSRSHTVFTITLHSRELTPDGEELVKTGKLNLVDLAGSENITKSGAVEKRAREAGNINQSLLTLGRVIKALVDNSSHIPYRESKLTRILQDSLGGRTKTAIIATISPASNNLEETLSTLDYAFRARNITNRPEINQRMSKKALIQKYLEEIEQLKKDLTAARTQHGIYLNPENYESMVANEKKQKDELYKTVQQCSIFESRYKEVQRMKEELEECCNVAKSELAHTNEELEKLKSLTKLHRKERRIHQKLIDIYDDTQTAFHEHSKRLSEHLDLALRDQRLLVSKVQNMYGVIERNESCTNEFGHSFAGRQAELDNFFCTTLDEIKDKANDIYEKHASNRESAINIFCSYDNSLDHFKLVMNNFGAKTKEVLDTLSEYCTKGVDSSEDLAKSVLDCNGKAVQNLTRTMDEELSNIHKIVDVYQKRLIVDKKYHEEQFTALRKEINAHQALVLKCFERLRRNVNQYLEFTDPIAKKVEGCADTMFRRCLKIETDISSRLDKLALDVMTNIDEIKRHMSHDHVEDVKTILNEQREYVFQYQNYTQEFMKKLLNKFTKYSDETERESREGHFRLGLIQTKTEAADKANIQVTKEIEVQMATVLTVIESLQDRGVLIVNSYEGLHKGNREIIEGIIAQREQAKEDAEAVCYANETEVNDAYAEIFVKRQALDVELTEYNELTCDNDVVIRDFREAYTNKVSEMCEHVSDYLDLLVFPKRQGDTPNAKQTVAGGATPKKVSKSLLAQLYEEEPDSDSDTTESF